MPDDTKEQPAPAEGQQQEAATDSGKDWQADLRKALDEAEKWKELARKHEGRAKENADKAKRFDEVTEAQKTEQQKLQERAEKAERELAEVQQRAMKAEVAATKGVPAELLTGSTQEEIEAAADKLLAFRGQMEPPKPKADFGAGDRGSDIGGKPEQITSREQLQKMTPEEIKKAKTEGRLTDLLTGRT